MNLPDKKREAVVAAVAQEVTEHAAHMETYTLPALQPGFIDGWMHAMRLLTRDAGFIGSKSADALAPLLAGWLAEARGQAVRSMAHLFRDMAQETLPRHEVIALLDLRAESYRADAAETTGGGA